MKLRPASVVGVVALAGLAAAIVFLPPPSSPRPDPSRRPPATVPGVESTPSGESAVDAALRFARSPQQWLHLSDDDLADELASQLAPNSEPLGERLALEAAEARHALAGTSATVWFVVAPLAWRIESSSDTAAVVSVWAVTVLSAPGVAATQADYTTTRITLERIDGTWRLAGFDDRPGPTPQPGSTDMPWSPERVDDALDGFTRIGVT